MVRFENLEGMILFGMKLTGMSDRDTSGLFVFDTGAGYLALDLPLARHLGLADSLDRPAAVDLAPRPLPRLQLGDWTIHQVQPVLTVDAEVVRRVTDRPVLGLIGHAPLRDHAIWIDYQRGLAALVPVDSKITQDSERLDDPTVGTRSAEGLKRSRERMNPLLSPRARAVPFRLAGDGKIVVRGRVSDPQPPSRSAPLELIVDTGATKSVLFEDALAGAVRHAERWRTLRGLLAPTLIGSAEARVAMIPEVEIESVAAEGRAGPPLRLRNVDTGVIKSELSGVLSRVTRTRIHGLIGYSFLRHFRVVIDYPERILWLDPIPGGRDDRRFEYSHVGLQLERAEGGARIAAVARGSPAERAGIVPGDHLVALDGRPAAALDLIALARAMEGPPGSAVTLVTRRGAVERTHRLVRRRLL